jgi:HlyD family secretion protein
MMAKSLGIFVVLGAVSATLGYSGYWRHAGTVSEPSSSESGPAVRLDKVTALGRLEPRGGVIALAGPPGGVIARLEVGEGKAVRRGDVIATLDGRDGVVAEREHLQAQICEAERRLEAEKRYEDALLTEARLGRRQVDELEPCEIEAQQAKVDLCRENQKDAKKRLEQLEGLSRSSAATTVEVDQARSAVRRTDDELKYAQMLLDKLSKAHEINVKRLEVEDRKAEAGAARAERAIPIDSLRAGLKLIDAKLAQLEIKAPADGRVLKVLARPGEATGVRPVVQLGDVDAMEAVAEVYETDRKRVREGQRAEVRSAALPEGRPTLHGVVERVGWSVAKNDVLGLDPAADAYARVVEVRIRLDAEDGRAVRDLTNLQVDVTIETARTGQAGGPGQRR